MLSKPLWNSNINVHLQMCNFCICISMFQNAISVVAPEDTFVLYTPTPSERNEWLYALQNGIKCSLQRVIGHVPPIVRSSSFSFTKHSVFKDAKYTGSYVVNNSIVSHAFYIIFHILKL